MTAAPLTEAQSGLWYAQRLDPANPIFNTGQYVELRGPLDREAFRDAVDEACAEADALALRIVEGPNGPEQFVDPSRRPRLSFVDATEADALAAIQRDLATVDGPLAAQTLYRVAPERHLWAQRIHHLVIDGYGTALLTNRVAELYNATIARRAAGPRDATGREAGSRDAAGRAPGPAFAPLQGVWAEDAAYRASARRAEDAAWWRETLAGADVVGMAPGRAVSAHRFVRAERRLPPSLGAGLRALAERHDLGWPDVLTALVAAYTRRFAAAAETVIGVPFMGRLGSASARVPAMVMNVLPLRVRPDEDAPLVDYLRQVSRALVVARRHGRYRGEQLRRDLGLLGGERRLYGALVNVLPFDQPPRFDGLDAHVHVLGTGPVDDVSFTFRGELGLTIDANPNLYRDAEIEAHGARLVAFLEAALDAETLGAIPTATAEEAARELDAFNATAHEIPATTLTKLLEESMETHAGSSAVRFGDRTMAYAELDRRSAALASVLVAHGAKPGAIVAVALPRSLELVVALVAVLRAGAAYLPIDLEHPSARIAKIIDSAKPVITLDEEGPLRPSQWTYRKRKLPAASPDDRAYVIYTSGSTGEPKGVEITHRAIVNRLLWMREHYGIGVHDRILQKTPATFDVSVWEFFLPLLSGARLVVAPPGAHRDPSAIARLVRDEEISTLHFVPSMLAAFLDAPEAAGLTPKRVFCSGEELPADLRDRFHRVLHAELHNLYGPTEAAVDVSHWPAGPEDRSRPVPIGHPVWNTRLVLLDERRRPVPPGIVGHLHLGGVQLARGYLGRPDLTAERFIDDPARPGQRLYVTGDLARRREDGAVVFLGRADHQVKIRGLRIELGEIEAAIAATSLTRGAAVIAKDARLVAYVVPGDGYAPEELRAALATTLPEYMLPAAFVELTSLPMTTNGKLDRAALPAPAFSSAGGALPASATEKKLAELFASVLDRREPIHLDDDFFALGGDSIAAVRLLLRVRDAFGRDPGLAALFEAPKLRDLAARVDADRDTDDGLGPIVTLRRGDPALAPLFVVHPAGGLAWGYRGLAAAMDPARTVYGLQAPALAPDVSIPESIDALAADYARRVVETVPAGPYHLAGWSVGGIVAQAMAVELHRGGHEVGLVAMLDSYPAECWRAEPEPTESAALRSLLTIAGYDPDRYPELQTRDAIVRFLRAGKSALGNLPEEALNGVIRVVLDTNRLVRAHQHRRYAGVLTHVRAAKDHVARPSLTPDLWRPYAGVLDRIDVPFLHPQLTGPEATAVIAPALSERMGARTRDRASA